MNDSVRNALTEARRLLEELYGERLVQMLLYGSHARGDAGTESDVDVLIVLRGEVRPHQELKRLAQVKLSLLERFDQYIVFQPFSERDFSDLSDPLMRNVHAEGVAL